MIRATSWPGGCQAASTISAWFPRSGQRPAAITSWCTTSATALSSSRSCGPSKSSGTTGGKLTRTVASIVMESVRASRLWWAAGLFSVLSLSGCATIPIDHSSTNPAAVASVTEDDEFSQLIAQLKSDYTRLKSRENDGRIHPTTEIAATHAPVTGLRMPLVGITAMQLSDSWGDPRDGGVRKHKGIDIF